jgi:acrylyl-CoA reductase (NADPH)
LRAFVAEKTDDGVTRGVRDFELDSDGDVLIRVVWSSVNYKDALATVPRGGVARISPLVPGIDLAGVVEEGSGPGFAVGDEVLAHGYELGMSHHGGFAEYARVPAEWVVPLRFGLSARDAMAIGTAGYTAMLSVLALERHGVRPDAGDVLVTGATGGVGSIAVALLAKSGHRVVAATGKASEGGYLRELGAADVVDRASLSAPGKPLQKERWAAVIDAVGSHTLANALAQTRYGGIVAACGLAQGADLPSTVMPFILRGVTLAGIDSVMAPLALREQAWQRLARDLDPKLLDVVAEEITLGDAIAKAGDLLAGRVRGRVVVAI